MADDRTEGSMKKMKGDVKEGTGKLTGDSKLQSEGKADKADKAEGKIQNAVGGIKDAVTGKDKTDS
ncbi:CsbD family protein (plasmid) [Skermanella sp. TT6]|uniref:CsbD family protein n=1 Tax=Skermanella cutis TaxID=2775420 RepID=A0ABX7BFX2_9PROT|nr:CsbD family protein [Skermanella sp. TT6]QQP93297.1 CsbD family protein [Skermanella sp. TT6]